MVYTHKSKVKRAIKLKNGQVYYLFNTKLELKKNIRFTQLIEDLCKTNIPKIKFMCCQILKHILCFTFNLSQKSFQKINRCFLFVYKHQLLFSPIDGVQCLYHQDK
jgi:hypothetical protein